MLGKKIGRGNTAEIFEYGPGKICKLFAADYPKPYVDLEYKNSMKVYSSGLSVPKVYDIVVENGRYGIVFERVDGINMLQMMIEDGEKLLGMYVALHKEFISQKANDVMSYKSYLSTMVKINGKDNNEEDLLAAIEALPDGEYLLHGDLHPNNILIKNDGIPVIIDFMNVCHGPKLFDIARSFFLLRRQNERLGKRYLELMDSTEEEIQKYLAVIAKCRKYE